MRLNVLYFASVREKIGVGHEVIETQAKTVAELIAQLVAKDERYDMAFADLSVLRIAVDQQLTDTAATIVNAHEVAFFPPMTGG